MTTRTERWLHYSEIGLLVSQAFFIAACIYWLFGEMA